MRPDSILILSSNNLPPGRLVIYRRGYLYELLVELANIRDIINIIKDTNYYINS